MTAKTEVLLGLAFVLGGCSFDGSTDGVVAGSQDDEEQTEIFLVHTEDTKRGGLIQGTYLDSTSVDGVSEVILAELKDDSERLEHKWELGPMPAGTYELAVVVQTYSPTSTDEFSLEYETDLERGKTELLVLGNSNDVMSYSMTVTLSAQSSLELRVKLDHKLATNDDGDPLRQFSVDYIALSRVD